MISLMFSFHVRLFDMVTPKNLVLFSIFQFPIMHSVCPPKILHKLLLRNALGNMQIRQTECIMDN